jgi:hypothetical protein
MCRDAKREKVEDYAKAWAKRIGGRYVVRDEQGAGRR